MQKKNSDNIFGFWDNCLWKCCYKLSLLKTEYLLSAVNGLTNSPDFAYHWGRLFQTELPSMGSINMVKVLSFSFQQCFRTFTLLLVKRSSEMRLFRHLSDHFFQTLEVQKYISYECLPFFENVQNWI